ncbi:alpha/beta hydrolase [Mycolicibacterium neoaurum]|uniref:alpha/beta hydrolase n=1 Tax=Mycolicibacterium neoaurum TaxID=1795 RepID=UPI00267179FD|nr:alpha/beta hydrolase [Mycolicibacterium neoaurum]MDO3401650.1 alpha/beta hydrolase [Mycolicibacterium neoaurum]
MSDSSPTRRTRAQRRAVRLFARAPRPVVRRLAAKAPTNADGETLAPEVHLALALLNRLPGSDYSDKPVEHARRHLLQEAVVFGETFGPFAVEEHLSIPGPAGTIPATRYRARATKANGLIVYFHGGGWVLGDRTSTESIARFLAVHTGAQVLSVDYRLAPEHPYPAAIDDGHAAWEYAVAHAPQWGIDVDRLVVAGDSAGANISAVLAQRLRGNTYQPRLQVLFCPVTDLSTEHPSYGEFAQGFFLTRKQMRWFKDHYVSDPVHAHDPGVSPLLADDVGGVAPAYIGIAGFDPLRDEGIAYAERLRAAGVPTTLHRASSMIHAYVNITRVSRTARESTLHACRAISDALRL